MLSRLVSSAIRLYLLGYALFVVLLPRPADDRQTDAIVVLTGRPKRIERGLDLLERGRAKRMLISGVARTVRPVELAAEYEADQALFRSEEHTSELQSLMRISYAVFCLTQT